MGIEDTITGNTYPGKSIMPSIDSCACSMCSDTRLRIQFLLTHPNIHDHYPLEYDLALARLQERFRKEHYAKEENG